MKIKCSYLLVLLTTFMLMLSMTVICYTQNTVDQQGEYIPMIYKKGDQVLNYQIMYPHDFVDNRKYPLMIFLHGGGERGDDNSMQLIHGSKLFKDSLIKYPAIVIFPQCPKDDYWANLYRPDKGGSSRVFEFHISEEPNPSMSLVIELIESMLSKEFIDNDRLYIAGLSMGAMGVWELLWRIPEKVTAAVPICGGGPTEMAYKMTNVPIWAFHGVKDDVVHPRYSRNMVTAVQKKGGKARITLFPDANHNSWDPAFNDPMFLRWLFSKSKN